jgi:amino acid transporter
VAETETGGLRRSLGLLDVVALGVNGVVGSGIFFLPGIVAEQIGPAALVVVAFGGLLCFLIALCFAEVGSRVRGTGGPYLYARAAFGPFVGFEVGWMTWWVRVISWAALANAFALALAPWLPSAGAGGTTQALVAAGLILGLAAVNLGGAAAGARLTTVLTVAKLLPLALFVAAGLPAIDAGRFTPFAPHGWSSFAEATSTMLFAYVGFEVLAVPAGEMRDPERAVPRALLLVLGLTSLLYAAVVAVAIGTHPELAGARNPVAEASTHFLGPAGATLIAAGIAVSVFGINASSALVTPRCLYALAEGGELPAWLAAVSPRRGTPDRAILISAALSAALAASGSFKTLALISVVARFAQYLPTCLAVLVLRRRDGPAPFRLPLGPTIPLLALALGCGLLLRSEPDRVLAGVVAAALGVPVYLGFRRRRA